MKISNSVLSSIQNSISAGINSVTDGAEQINTVQAAQINTALDSFQSVQAASDLNQLQATSAFSEAGGFSDPLSFYSQQTSESPVVQQLKDPVFEAMPNLKSLFDELQNVTEPFASRGGIHEANAAFSSPSMTIPPSQTDPKFKELSDQFKAKTEELRQLKEEILSKKEEYFRKVEEWQANKNKLGVPVLDEILGVIGGSSFGLNDAPPEDVRKAQQELGELEARAAKLNQEIEELSEQIENRKNELDANVETDMVGKAQRNLSVDPFSATIEMDPNQTLINFSRVIGLQLDFNADRLLQQRSLYIKA
jgi:hypothetical protein